MITVIEPIVCDWIFSADVCGCVRTLHDAFPGPWYTPLITGVVLFIVVFGLPRLAKKEEG